MVLQTQETVNNFNVSNLTRALEFHPRPLLNSTPERNHQGYRNRMSLQKEDNHYLEATSDIHHPGGSVSSVSHAVDFFNRFNTTEPQKYVFV